MGDFSEKFMRPSGQKIHQCKKLHLNEKKKRKKENPKSDLYRTMDPKMSFSTLEFAEDIATVFAAEGKMA